MKKLFTFLTSFLLVFTITIGLSSVEAWASSEPRITGTGAVVYCATTNEVLWSKDADTTYNPASMTKLLTCLVAAETLGVDYKVTVAQEATQITKYESIVYAGEEITVGELIYESLMISANDSAKALALAVAETEEDFARLMNDRIKKIGCTKSEFHNASGIAANGNKATPYEMALIAKEALSNEFIRTVVGTTEHTVPATNKTEERVLEAGNLLLAGGETETSLGNVTVEKYPGIIGGKTGTTDKSKATMVVGCKMLGLELYVVTMNSTLTQRYKDITNMLNWARDIVNPYEVFPAGSEFEETKIKAGATNRITGIVNESVLINLPEGASASLITTEAKYDEKLTAPIEEGQEIGKLIVYLAGDTIREVPLFASKQIKKGWFLSGFGITNVQTIIIFGVLFILIVGFLVIVKIRQNNIKKRNLKRQERIRQMAEEEMKKQEDWEKRGWTYHG